MTVAELIERLTTMPADAEVLTVGRDDRTRPVADVRSYRNGQVVEID